MRHHRPDRRRPAGASAGLTILAAGALALAAPAASAQTAYLFTSLQGAVQSAGEGSPFQIGPAAAGEGDPALDGAPGTFGYYEASPGLPQITGGDLSRFGFSLYTTGVTPVSAATYDYTGTFRIYAPGYGYGAGDGQILEHGTFSAEAVFSDPETAGLRGVFTFDPGPLQPPGYPAPVDFAAAGPAAFSGGIYRGGAGETLGGYLTNAQPGGGGGDAPPGAPAPPTGGDPSPPTAVPEAGALPLLLLGTAALIVGGLGRRRRTE